MLKHWILTALICSFCLPAWADQSARFFTMLHDVPLMPGLEERVEESLVFDKAEGRIVESVATADFVTKSDIIQFYEAALPQFGWQRLGETTYKRQKETLEFYVDKNDEGQIVRFMVKPGEG